MASPLSFLRQNGVDASVGMQPTTTPLPAIKPTVAKQPARPIADTQRGAIGMAELSEANGGEWGVGYEGQMVPSVTMDSSGKASTTMLNADGTDPATGKNMFKYGASVMKTIHDKPTAGQQAPIGQQAPAPVGKIPPTTAVPLKTAPSIGNSVTMPATPSVGKAVPMPNSGSKVSPDIMNLAAGNPQLAQLLKDLGIQ
jgi:hypothetical protein